MEMKTVYLIIGAVAFAPIAAVAFFRGASQGDDMTQKMGNEKEETKHEDKKPQAEAAKELAKKKDHEGPVGDLTENFNADHRTDTGVAVMATEEKFADHHSLDEGVDVNAPRVDPGHIRNAVAEENGYIPAQDVEKEEQEEAGEDVVPTFKSDKKDEELDADAVKKENKK